MYMLCMHKLTIDEANPFLINELPMNVVLVLRIRREDLISDRPVIFTSDGNLRIHVLFVECVRGCGHYQIKGDGPERGRVLLLHTQ